MPGENAHELTSRVTDLKSELEDLEQKERMLDQQKFWVEQSIRNTTEDCSKYPFCFVLFFTEDIAKSGEMYVFIGNVSLFLL